MEKGCSGSAVSEDVQHATIVSHTASQRLYVRDGHRAQISHAFRSIKMVVYIGMKVYMCVCIYLLTW